MAKKDLPLWDFLAFSSLRFFLVYVPDFGCSDMKEERGSVPLAQQFQLVQFELFDLPS